MLHRADKMKSVAKMMMKMTTMPKKAKRKAKKTSSSLLV